MQYSDVIATLKTMEQPKNIQGMIRYGINPINNLGISIYQLRHLAKEIGTNHDLALKLWDSGIHDARLLAVFIDDPIQVTSEQMDAWAADFDSWDICDQACTSLFDKTPHAWTKVYTWATRKEEFVKRGAFALLAGLAVHDKKATNQDFERCAPLIKKCCTDDRNYAKKAVNWALRNIGKRNQPLNKKMIQLSKELLTIDSQSARWIATDALRELTSEKVHHRIKTKKKKKRY
ncbi:MAG: DNA alkylation repair protein [Candidatus Thermoplasmatota archaeon]